jgi:hypothetical protein
LLENLKKIDAVLRVSIDNLITSYMAHVRHQDLLAQEVDQRLYAPSHHLRVLIIFIIFKQTREIKVWVRHRKALDVELVLEEDSHVIYHFLLAEVLPYLITEYQYCLYDLLLV